MEECKSFMKTNSLDVLDSISNNNNMTISDKRKVKFLRIYVFIHV